MQIGGFRGNGSYNLNVQSLNREGAVCVSAQARSGDQRSRVQDVSDSMELRSRA
jgi:hypothetical protein